MSTLQNLTRKHNFVKEAKKRVLHELRLNRIDPRMAHILYKYYPNLFTDLLDSHYKYCPDVDTDIDAIKMYWGDRCSRIFFNDDGAYTDGLVMQELEETVEDIVTRSDGYLKNKMISFLPF